MKNESGQQVNGTNRTAQSPDREAAFAQDALLYADASVAVCLTEEPTFAAADPHHHDQHHHDHHDHH